MSEAGDPRGFSFDGTDLDLVEGCDPEVHLGGRVNDEVKRTTKGSLRKSKLTGGHIKGVECANTAGVQDKLETTRGFVTIKYTRADGGIVSGKGCVLGTPVSNAQSGTLKVDFVAETVFEETDA